MYLVLLIFTCFPATFTEAEVLSMRIVEEPSNYGTQNFWNVYNEGESLKMRIRPSNFSGPPHLRWLYGKCFNQTDSMYRYMLCPFFNVTQHEMALRWNPYNGILGIWQEWEIENNTFTAMLMKEGDKCGKIYRSVRVVFKCARENGVTNVSEPHTCHYQIVFSTPFVCHRHSMLVYPTINKKLKVDWNELEGELEREEITLQGYYKGLRKIFEEAGYYVTKEKQAEMAQTAIKNEMSEKEKSTGEFTSLPNCQEEYKKLMEEVKGLRTLLEINKRSNQKGYGMELYGNRNNGQCKPTLMEHNRPVCLCAWPSVAMLFSTLPHHQGSKKARSSKNFQGKKILIKNIKERKSFSS